MSSIQQFEALGVDHRFVLRDNEHLCGICFSFSEDGERTMLTHAGVNEFMADYIDREFTNIVTYLSGARVIHVTSFLDSRTAGRILKMLQAVKTVNRGTLICFDPGHVWSVDPAQEIQGIVRISDYLLVNYREFRELGEYRSDDSNDDVAARLLGRFDSERSVIIVKRPTGIWSYWREGEKIISDFYPQVPLPLEEVEDATGAGDVFAAGLLIVLTNDKLQVELGSLLGMRLPGTNYDTSAAPAMRSSPRSRRISSVHSTPNGVPAYNQKGCSLPTVRIPSGWPSSVSSKNDSSCQCTRLRAVHGAGAK